jgi:exodeoxyribonuclease V alpha subunit
LRHAAFRGFSFGKSKIIKLIDAFGADELVKILNNSDTASLSKVINNLIAEKLVNRWSTLTEEIQLAEFLIEHKFDWNIQRHIVRLCKSGAVEKLKSNPYALVYFSSISKNIWRTVEDCAGKLGIPKDSEARLNGAIELALYDRLAKGHTSTKIHKLIELSEKYTGSNQLSTKGVTAAINRKSVCFYDDGDTQHVQLAGPAMTELMLEKRLSRIWADKRQLSIFGQDKRYADELSIKLKQYQISNRINLNKKQEVSVIEALTNRLSITTGFGGTGKTTILKAVADLCENSGRAFNLLAYSGKAADRIRLSTGRSAQTIHSLIQSLKSNQLEEWTESDPLLIIDESSMVEPALLNKLLSYFDGKSLSLLMVGDPAQLSPVGWGIAWHTLAESKDISITHLTDVYRTDNEPLHDAAMAVRTGEVPDIPMWNDEAEGIYFVESYQ